MASDPNAYLRTIDQLLIQAGQNIKQNYQGRVHSVFGYDYAGGIVDDGAYRQKLYPQPGETYAQWVRRVDQELPGFSSLVGNGQGQSGPDQQGLQRHHIESMIQQGALKGFTPEQIKQLRDSGGFADPDNLGQAEDRGQSAQQADQQSAEVLLRRFAEAMNRAPDMNDPYVKQIVQGAAGVASDQARMRGLSGGYAVSNTENAATQALTGIGLQRQQLGLQALQGAGNLGMQQAQMNLAAYDRQYQAQLQQMQQQYQQGLGGAQSTGALIGGVIGGVGGAYFGGPAGAQAGFAAGSQIGGGIGGMSYGGGPRYVPYNPSGFTPPAAGYSPKPGTY